MAEPAAEASLGIAKALDMKDPAQKKAAIEVVREVIQVLKKEETLAAAKEFVGKHGS